MNQQIITTDQGLLIEARHPSGAVAHAEIPEAAAAESLSNIVSSRTSSLAEK